MSLEQNTSLLNEQLLHECWQLNGLYCRFVGECDMVTAELFCLHLAG